MLKLVLKKVTMTGASPAAPSGTSLPSMPPPSAFKEANKIRSLQLRLGQYVPPAVSADVPDAGHQGDPYPVLF